MLVSTIIIVRRVCGEDISQTIMIKLLKQYQNNSSTVKITNIIQHPYLDNAVLVIVDIS